ncbi:MAG TPA: ABC transporter permease [bacterium]|nr:ABC transporter permease [bacterium]
MKKFLYGIGSIISILALWQALSLLGGYPRFILPAPVEVLVRAQRLMSSGQLLPHLSVTLAESLAGFAVSALLALILGYLAASYRRFHLFVKPYILGLQAVPVLAVAPLLIIWFGSGFGTKVIIASLISFLPMFAADLQAFRSIGQVLRWDMQLLGATRWQTFFKLELPAAAPGILTGMKVGASLSLMGAVVGEFVGAQRGLGYLINLGKGLLDTPLVFTAIALLVILGLGLYAVMTGLEKLLLSLR